MRQHIGNQLHQAQALLNDSQSAKNLQNFKDQLEKLHGQNETLRDENKKIAGQVTSLEAERNSLHNQVAALQSVSPVIIEQGSQLDEEKMAEPEKSADRPPEPDWMMTWRQSETFERDASILTMIG